MRKISSSKPELQRSCTDTAPSKTYSDFYQNGHDRASVHTEDDTAAQFTAPPRIGKLKKDQMVLGERRSILVAFFLPNLHSNIAPNWQGIKNTTRVIRASCVLAIRGLLLFWLNLQLNVLSCCQGLHFFFLPNIGQLS